MSPGDLNFLCTSVAHTIKHYRFTMRLFHPVNSWVVSRNLWLILVNKIWLFLNLVKHTSKNQGIANLSLFFSSFSGCWVITCQQFCDFSVNKSCKTHLKPILPPGGRNWQLISPHQQKIAKFCCRIVFLPLSVSSPGFDKRFSLLQILYITNL